MSLGAFDFARLGADQASQISEMKSIGYGGLVMPLANPKLLERLHRYQAAIADDPFEIYAGYVVVDFAKDIDAQNTHLDKVIRSLKK